MKFIHQNDKMDCGPACLAMISSFYGKQHSLQYLRAQSYLTKFGVSLAGVSFAAEKIGLKNTSYKMSVVDLKNRLENPCILHWNNNHFVVLYKIDKNNRYFIADPAFGKIRLSEEEFQNAWFLKDCDSGHAMFLMPTDSFYQKKEISESNGGMQKVVKHFRMFKGDIFKILYALFITSILTLFLPFLTQSLIDYGIKRNSIDITYLILSSQLVIFLGSSFIDIIRNRLTLNTSSKINILIISSFFKKLLKLPVEYFESKSRGDFSQRINDHEKIESFLTSQMLITFFSFLTFIVFGVVLFSYNPFIMIIYLSMTLLSVAWLSYFFNKRKRLDYQRFVSKSDNQESIFEIINGIQEIKLNNVEEKKRKTWEGFQLLLFRINLGMLKLEQVQIGGFNLINQMKNLVMTFLSAQLVIKGQLTLGELLSISFIIGQMNSPINQLIGFSKSFLDAKLSLQRLNEIEEEEEEEYSRNIMVENCHKSIALHNVSFRYGHPNSPLVIDKIDVCFEYGKTTAIVGASGSGKTTLLKLILGFYKPTMGQIALDDYPLEQVSLASWRSQCGVVMQDGYIFSDTILENIICGEVVDYERLENALDVARLKDFILKVPMGLQTKIGGAGIGLSGGQKQRILIARAVYKNPNYFLLDEATSSLDSQNERKIHDALQSMLMDKTVIIIAHRLSTVKKADKIIVMENGKVIEMGTHMELLAMEGKYFDLIKNQLELEKS